MALLKRETLKNILSATQSQLAVGYIHKLLFIYVLHKKNIWPLLRLDWNLASSYYTDVLRATARFRNGDLTYTFYSIVYQAMCLLGSPSDNSCTSLADSIILRSSGNMRVETSSPVKSNITKN